MAEKEKYIDRFARKYLPNIRIGGQPVSPDQFKADMQSPEKAKMYYKELSGGATDYGGFNDWYSQFGFEPTASPTATPAAPAGTATTSTTNMAAQGQPVVTTPAPQSFQHPNPYQQTQDQVVAQPPQMGNVQVVESPYPQVANPFQEQWKQPPINTVGDYIERLNILPEDIGLSPTFNQDKILTQDDLNRFNTRLGIKEDIAANQAYRNIDKSSPYIKKALEGFPGAQLAYSVQKDIQGDDPQGSYTWGTIDAVNRGTAEYFKSLSGAVKLLGAALPTVVNKAEALEAENLFGSLAEHIEKNTVGQNYVMPQGVAGEVAEQMGALNGFFLELMNPLKSGFFKMPITMATAATLRKVDKEGKTPQEGVGEEEKGYWATAGKGALDGAILATMGLVAGKAGQVVMKRTGSEAKSVLTSVLSNAGMFGGLTAAEGGTTSNVIASTIAGGLLGAPAVAKLVYGGTVNRALNTTSETLKTAESIKATPEDIMSKIEDIGEPKTQAESMQKTALENLLATKAGIENIIRDPRAVIDEINSSDMTPDEKQIYIDKVNTIVAEYDPIVQATKPMTEGIDNAKKNIEVIEANPKLSDTQKEVLAGKEKATIKELEAQVAEIVNPKPVPEGETPKQPVEKGETMGVDSSKTVAENIVGDFGKTSSSVIKSKGSSNGKTLTKSVDIKLSGDGEVITIKPVAKFTDGTGASQRHNMTVQEFKDRFYPEMTEEERGFFEDVSKGEDVVYFKEARIGAKSRPGQLNIDIIFRDGRGFGFTSTKKITPEDQAQMLGEGKAEKEAEIQEPIKVTQFAKGEGGTKGVFEGEDGKLYKSLQPQKLEMAEEGAKRSVIEGAETKEHEILSELQDNPNVPKIGNIVETSEGKAFEIERLEEIDTPTYEEYKETERILNELNDKGYHVGDDITIMRRPNTGEIVVTDFSNGYKDAPDRIESRDIEYLSKLRSKLSPDDKAKVDVINHSVRLREQAMAFKKPKSVFGYLMTQRPPSIGTHPIEGRVSDPVEVDFSDGRRKAWRVEYNRELTPKEIRDYELSPLLDPYMYMGKMVKGIFGDYIYTIENINDRSITLKSQEINGKSKVVDIKSGDLIEKLDKGEYELIDPLSKEAKIAEAEEAKSVNHDPAKEPLSETKPEAEVKAEPAKTEPSGEAEITTEPIKTEPNEKETLQGRQEEVAPQKETAKSSQPNYITVHRGGTTKIGKFKKGQPLFVSEYKNQAEYYSKEKGVKSKVSSFEIDNNKIADEDLARNIIDELNLKSKDSDYNTSELNLYELIDPNFETSMSIPDIGRLFAEVEKRGYDGIRFTDSNLKTLKNDISSIVLINPQKSIKGLLQKEAPKAEAKPIDKAKEQHNSLVKEMIRYNNSTPAERKKIGTAAITQKASELGYDVATKGGKIIVSKDGKQIKTKPTMRSAEEVQQHKGLSEYDEQFQKFVNAATSDLSQANMLDVGLDTKQRTQALKDLKAGKKSAAANDFLDRMEDMYNRGGMETVEGSGGATNRKFVPTEDLIAFHEHMKTELTPEEKTEANKLPDGIEDTVELLVGDKATAENIESLRKELTEGFPALTKEEFDLYKEYLNERDKKRKGVQDSEMGETESPGTEKAPSGEASVGKKTPSSYSSRSTEGLPLNPQSKAPSGTKDLDNVITLRNIGKKLIKDIGLKEGQSVRHGFIKNFRRKARALFFPDLNILRVNNVNDIRSLSHEIGHYLDDTIFGINGMLKSNLPIRKELLSMLRINGYPEVKVKEGIAEFVKYYITDPAKAKKEAPLFHSLFEGIVANNEQINSAITQARDSFEAFRTQTAMQIIESTVNREVDKHSFISGVKNFISSGGSKFIMNFFDSIQGIREIDNALKKAGISSKSSQSAAKRMLSLIGIDGKVTQWLENHPVEIQGEDIKILKDVKGLLQVLAPVSKKGLLKQYEGYLIAQRNVELHNNGKGDVATMPLDVSEQAIREYETYYPNEDFKAFSDDIRAYEHAVLDYYEKSGKISAEANQEIKDKNNYHIPFQRYFEAFEEKGNMMSAKNAPTSASPIKKAQGSVREITSPFESIIRNTYAVLQAADKNIALKTIIDGLTKLQDHAKSKGEVSPLVQEIPSKRITAFRDINSGELKFTMKGGAPDGKIISVWEDGKVKYYEIDPDIYDSIFQASERVSEFIRVASLPSRWLQAGAVVYDPTFMFRNIPRDQMSALFYSNHGYSPIDFIRGISQAINKGDHYQKWLASGGDQSFLTSMDKVMQRDYLEKRVSNRLKNRWGQYVMHPLEVLQDLSRMSEIGTRVGAFKNAYNKTGNVWDAMEESRTISADYGVKGSALKNIAPLYPFLNARAQHMKMTAITMKNHPARTFAKGVAFVTAPAILNWIANNWTEEDRKRYQALPEWRKLGLFNIHIPGTDSYLPIPKGFWGTAFGTTAEAFLDSMLAGDERTKDGIVQQLWKEFSPITSLPELTPQAIRPIVSQWANKRSFLGKPIVPESMKQLPASEQYFESTPEIIKKLGDAVGVSPLRIDALIRDYTGGAGAGVVEILDMEAQIWGLVDKKPDDTFTTLSKMPVTKAFVTETPRGARSSYVQDFYEKLDEMEEISATVNKHIANDKTDKLDKMLSDKEKAKDLQWYWNNQTEINKFKTILRYAKTMKMEIMKDNSIVDKRARGKAIDDIITNIGIQFRDKYEAGEPFRLGKDALDLYKAEKSEKKQDSKSVKDFKSKVKKGVYNQ